MNVHDKYALTIKALSGHVGESDEDIIKKAIEYLLSIKQTQSLKDYLQNPASKLARARAKFHGKNLLDTYDDYISEIQAFHHSADYDSDGKSTYTDLVIPEGRSHEQIIGDYIQEMLDTPWCKGASHYLSDLKGFCYMIPVYPYFQEFANADLLVDFSASIRIESKSKFGHDAFLFMASKIHPSELDDFLSYHFFHSFNASWVDYQGFLEELLPRFNNPNKLRHWIDTTCLDKFKVPEIEKNGRISKEKVAEILFPTSISTQAAVKQLDLYRKRINFEFTEQKGATIEEYITLFRSINLNHS
jgi:hypothetical protein